MSGDPDTCDLLCLDILKAEAARGAQPPADTLERAAQAARALGDPTRLAIALALDHAGEACVCDLAWVVGREEKSVSHHVRLLKSAGLANSRRDGRMVMYALTEQGTALVHGQRAALELVAS